MVSPRSQLAAAGSGSTVIFLTSGSTWTVPSDWNSSNNTIEVIGGGGGGGSSQYSNGGGGGGAWSKVTNASLTPGATVGVQVGSGGGILTVTVEIPIYVIIRLLVQASLILMW